MTKRIVLLVIAFLNMVSANGQEIKYSIDPSYVFPKSRVNDIVRKAARDFGRRHPGAYISKAEYIRTVKAADGYCFFRIDDGLFGSTQFVQDGISNYLEDPGAGKFWPLNSVCSLFRIPGTRDYAHFVSVHNSDVKGIDSYYVNFNQMQRESPVAWLRAMEVSGPINVSKLKYYDFALEGYSPDNDLYIIRFNSKEGSFPKKIRLCGEGILYISRLSGLMGFKLINMEDRFSSYIRTTIKDRLISVTSSDLEVRYGRVRGYIVPESIIRKTRWVEPEDKTRVRYYEAEVSPCRNPFSCRLLSETTMVFREVRMIGMQETAQYSPYFKPSLGSWYPCFLVTDPECSTPNLSSLGDSREIRRDLESIGIGLEDQSSLYMELIKKEILKNGGEIGLSSVSFNMSNARDIYKFVQTVFLHE